MREYASDMIRNIAVLSHDGVGKTALIEGMLYTAGAIKSVGIGQQNKHIMDFEPEEIERNVTIKLGIAPCEWNGNKLNFIDTPGYSEFCGEVRAGLRASDGMLIVVSAEAGVEVDTERSWDYSIELKIPKMIFINKMDAENANFYKTLQEMKTLFGKSIMPLQIPIGEGANFRGIIDVAKQQAWEWKDGKAIDIEIPAEYLDKLKEVREIAIEAAAEGDDDLLTKYLDGADLTLEEIRLGLRKGMISGKVCPVMCGSATKLIGMDKLLDRFIRYLPDSTTRIMTATNIHTKQEEIVTVDKPFTAFVFKTVIDPFAGKLSFIRIFSGKLNENDKLYNITQDKEERCNKLYSVVGKQQELLSTAQAGDIIVIPKLNHTNTGDTFCDPAFPVIYKQIRFPNPLHSVALIPESKGDEEKLTTALNKVSEEDPSCYVEKNIEAKQIQLSTMGEVHLEYILHKMERKYGVKAEIGHPYIPYRETIKKKVSVESKYKKQSGGHGQYGHVFIEVEPTNNEKEFEFIDKIVGGVIPKQYIPAVEKGIKETLDAGLIAGYPMINVQATLFDGTHHSVDSSDLAFKLAGAQAIRKAIPDANPVLLEPIYQVNIIVPEENTGEIMGSVNSKRGKVLGMEQGHREGISIIKALIPLAEMHGYVAQLRSMTKGRGTFNMQFDRYEEMPTKQMSEIVQQYNKLEE